MPILKDTLTLHPVSKRDMPLQVPAQLFADLAITQSAHYGGKKYDVVHVPTGLKIWGNVGYRKAVKLKDMLKSLPINWAFDDVLTVSNDNMRIIAKAVDQFRNEN